MKINEIFKSIQGETIYQGLPFLFIRVTGCNLRCRWCDTTYAYEEGREYSITELLRISEDSGCKYIMITGGEPLIHRETPILAGELLKRGYTVLVETNGSIDISILPEKAVKVMDIKCPGSGMADAMRWEHIKYLSPKDEVKFVISDYRDYMWMKNVINRYELLKKCSITVSPAFNILSPQELAEWIIRDSLMVRFQLQIHKYIWNGKERGI